VTREPSREGMKRNESLIRRQTAELSTSGAGATFDQKDAA
jgi:hypothetical protein